MRLPWRLRLGLWIGVTAIYWSSIAFVMHVPPSTAPKQPGWFDFPHADKAVHLVLYFILTGLIGRTVSAYRAAFGRGENNVSNSTALALFGVVAVYGLIDELTQPLTGRHCDPWDFAVDVVAALCGVGLWKALCGRAAANSRAS